MALGCPLILAMYIFEKLVLWSGLQRDGQVTVICWEKKRKAWKLGWLIHNKHGVSMNMYKQQHVNWHLQKLQLMYMRHCADISISPPSKIFYSYCTIVLDHHSPTWQFPDVLQQNIWEKENIEGPPMQLTNINIELNSLLLKLSIWMWLYSKRSIIPTWFGNN